MTRFLTGNEWQWRLSRMIVQGVLSVFVAGADLIVGFVVLDPTMRALVMAVLLPVLAEIGKGLPEGE